MNGVNQRGETALIEEAGYHGGDPAIARLLIDKGTDVNARDNYGTTALLRASTSLSPLFLKVLISRGADIEAKDREGFTSLMRAASLGRTTLVQILLSKGADVHAVNNKGRTALWWATQNGHTETVTALIDKGADVNVKDNSGRTAYNGGHRETEDYIPPQEGRSDGMKYIIIALVFIVCQAVIVYNIMPG